MTWTAHRAPGDRPARRSRWIALTLSFLLIAEPCLGLVGAPDGTASETLAPPSDFSESSDPRDLDSYRKRVARKLNELLQVYRNYNGRLRVIDELKAFDLAHPREVARGILRVLDNPRFQLARPDLAEILNILMARTRGVGFDLGDIQRLKEVFLETRRGDAFVLERLINVGRVMVVSNRGFLKEWIADLPRSVGPLPTQMESVSDVSAAYASVISRVLNSTEQQVEQEDWIAMMETLRRKFAKQRRLKELADTGQSDSRGVDVSGMLWVLKASVGEVVSESLARAMTLTMQANPNIKATQQDMDLLDEALRGTTNNYTRTYLAEAMARALGNHPKLSVPAGVAQDLVAKVHRGGLSIGQRSQMATMLGHHLLQEPSVLREAARATRLAIQAPHEDKVALLRAIATAVALEPARREELMRMATGLLGLSSIRLNESGDAPSTVPAFAEVLLQKAEVPAELYAPPRFPHRRLVTLQDLNGRSEALDAMIAESAFVKAVGRTLMYQRPDGTYLFVKLRSGKVTDPMDLLQESEVQEELRRKAEDMVLWADYPVAFREGQRRLFVVGPFGEAERRALEGQIDPYKGKPPVRLAEGQTTVALAYTMADPGYMSYLDDPSQDLALFTENALTNLHDLMVLARHGLIHTAPLTMYHAIDSGRDDQGIFLWMIDLLHPNRHRRGAGRMHAYPLALQAANLGKTGPRDLAEVYRFGLLLSPNHPRSAHLAGFRGDRHLRRAVPAYYLANYLGESLLAVSLLLGSLLAQRGELDWRKPEPLAEVTRGLFNGAYAVFTGQRPADFRWLEDAVDWEMLAVQMAYFMDPKREFAADVITGKVPQEVFALPRGRVGYDRDLLANASHIVEERGDPAAWLWRHDEVYPDLGPHNGPFVLQELIKALYLYSAFMVDSLRTDIPAPRPAQALPASMHLMEGAL